MCELRAPPDSMQVPSLPIPADSPATAMSLIKNIPLSAGKVVN